MKGQQQAASARLAVHMLQAQAELHQLGHDLALVQQPPAARLQVGPQVALLRQNWQKVVSDHSECTILQQVKKNRGRDMTPEWLAHARKCRPSVSKRVSHALEGKTRFMSHALEGLMVVSAPCAIWLICVPFALL